MNRAAGYFLVLSADRYELFTSKEYETFAEPVNEFKHSRNLPLICFITNSNGQLTDLAFGSRGLLAGTDLRRLNLSRSYKLNFPIPISDITNHVPTRVKNRVTDAARYGGLLAPKSFQAVIEALYELAPDSIPILKKFSESRTQRIENIGGHSREMLAEQKEAIATAMTIAGIDRKELQGWDIQNTNDVQSFLSGIESARVREDSMVINDLSELPGHEIISKSQHGSVVFENSKSKLTVVIANRLPLEEQFGVDLIYYNETFSCFLMIQYKAMEEENGKTVFRFPNAQLTTELDRMNRVLVELQKCASSDHPDGFRFSDNPFFLKICPRIIFNPDNIGLVKGMYLPLGYWDKISTHPSIKGPKGGMNISYENVRRYLDNSEFITLASGGWVGTSIEQSKLLEEAIESTIESGRAVVFAVAINKDGRHRRYDG